MVLTRKEFNSVLRDSKIELMEFRRTYGLDKRHRVKPREEDRRRKYSYTDDYRFCARWRELKFNQSALARELGISQPAVRKRLLRIHRENAEIAPKTLLMVKMALGDIPSSFWNVTLEK